VVDGPKIPDELRVCVVEDWTAPGEMFGEFVDPMIVARRRWKEARGEWAEAHGITPRGLSAVAPYGRPVFRDETHFLAQHPEARRG